MRMIIVWLSVVVTQRKEASANTDQARGVELSSKSLIFCKSEKPCGVERRNLNLYRRL